jgi:hypothetical protein
MRRIRGAIGMGAVVAIAAALPVSAQGPTIEEVVGGLNSPRGVALGPDGTVYVVEAGVGGEGPCVDHPELVNLCFGPSGTVTAISDGTASQLVTDLPSGITPNGEVIGPSDVTVDAEGTVWFLVGGPGHGAAEFRDAIEGGAGEGIGQLYMVADGAATSVADLAAYETANNPDVDQPGNTDPDSNVNGLAASDVGAVVADAGGNDLLTVAADGTISTVAVFPVVMQPAPPDPAASPDPSAEPVMVPMDPVPTSVTVGEDGAYYVGTLTGFPFPVGGANVFRVVPGEEPTVYASGLTNIIDVEFGPDGTLYVLEIAHDGLLAALAGMAESGPGMGGLLAVPPGGGEAQLIASEGLPMPGGMAVAEDGSIYVSTCSVCPGAGAVVKVTP